MPTFDAEMMSLFSETATNGFFLVHEFFEGQTSTDKIRPKIVKTDKESPFSVKKEKLQLIVRKRTCLPK